MKFFFYILLFLIITNYWVASINNLRTTTKFKFDDPDLIEKSQAIWQKLSNPSLEKGYATGINKLFGELNVKVQTKLSTLSGAEKTTLTTDWDLFVTQFNQAAKMFNDIRDEMRKIQKEEDSQTKSEDDAKFETQKAANAEEIKKLGQKVATFASTDKAKVLKDAAIRGLAASMPPSFCWKKADVGTAPTNCPTAYPDRSGALCYRNCEAIKGEHGFTGDKANYKFHIWGGVCWEDCSQFSDGTPGTWLDKGLTCNKAGTGWHFKRSFITSSKTNFNSGVNCPAKMYKGLALCYRDCTSIGYKNCGIGACSIYKTTCYKEVAKMVWKSFVGVLKFIGFVLSFGASTAVTSALSEIQEVVDKIEIGVKIFEGFEISKTVFRNSEITNNVKAGCVKHATEILKVFPGGVTSTEVTAACDAAVQEEVTRQAKPETTFDPTTVFLDHLEEQTTGSTYGIASGFVGVLTECDWKKKEESSFKTSCARAVLEAFSGEPTGLVGLAAAFIYERCPQDL